MINPANKWEALDAHLLQVLHVLLTEKSVSNAAKRLNQSQPAISTALKNSETLLAISFWFVVVMA